MKLEFTLKAILSRDEVESNEITNILNKREVFNLIVQEPKDLPFKIPKIVANKGVFRDGDVVVLDLVVKSSEDPLKELAKLKSQKEHELLQRKQEKIPENIINVNQQNPQPKLSNSILKLPLEVVKTKEQEVIANVTNNRTNNQEVKNEVKEVEKEIKPVKDNLVEKSKSLDKALDNSLNKLKELKEKVKEEAKQTQNNAKKEDNIKVKSSLDLLLRKVAFNDEKIKKEENLMVNLLSLKTTNQSNNQQSEKEEVKKEIKKESVNEIRKMVKDIKPIENKAEKESEDEELIEENIKNLIEKLRKLKEKIKEEI